MNRTHRSTYSEGADSSNTPSVSMRGRVCVVTGATRGIGRATASILARMGATVVLIARDAEAGRRTLRDIQEEGASEPMLVVADLASLRSVQSAAEQIASRFDALHVLVNNAGVSVGRRSLSADGIELTLAVNHLAPFALTRLLLPLLERGSPSRIVNVSSEFERWGDLDLGDLQMARRYDETRAYLRSKVANVMFTYSLAERLGASRVTANCVYPGLVATDLLRDRWWWRAAWLKPIWRTIFLTPEQAGAGVAFVATASSLLGLTGKCFDRKGREVRTSKHSRDPELRARLWRASEELIQGGQADRRTVGDG